MKPGSSLKIDDGPVVPAPEDQEVYRCDRCYKPILVGRLGPGTNIEVRCRSRHCVRYKLKPYVRVVVMA